jgi:Zn-dependent peptidase ImmA (M78 family)
MKVALNLSRLQYLLDLYAMSTEELLERMTGDLVNSTKATDVFTEEIRVSYLKKIDKIFQRGLAFYLDPSDLPKAKSNSIFFRKSHLAEELNLGAKKTIDGFEEQQKRLTAYAKLAKVDIQRTVPSFTTEDQPTEAAKKVRALLYPKGKTQNTKEFLKRLFASLSDRNIFVFEFVETWNKTHKANIEGAYIAPNVIIIKRQQQSLKREVFTLAHELGHYLLNEEEAEKVVFGGGENISKIEKWCNAFAFHFLIGEQYGILINGVRNGKPDEALLNEISKYTHLSVSALYTQLLIKKRISYAAYRAKLDAVSSHLEAQDLQNDEKKQLGKELGLNTGRASAPKPIRSPLQVSVLRNAFHEGLVNEMDFCKSLHIKPEAIDKYLYE